MINLTHVKLHHQMIEEQFNKTVSLASGSKGQRGIVNDVLEFLGSHLIKLGDALLKLSQGFSYSTR
jgi:hypothetical protein